MGSPAVVAVVLLSRSPLTETPTRWGADCVKLGSPKIFFLFWVFLFSWLGFECSWKAWSISPCLFLSQRPLVKSTCHCVTYVAFCCACDGRCPAHKHSYSLPRRPQVNHILHMFSGALRCCVLREKVLVPVRGPRLRAHLLRRDGSRDISEDHSCLQRQASRDGGHSSSRRRPGP